MLGGGSVLCVYLYMFWEATWEATISAFQECVEEVTI